MGPGLECVCGAEVTALACYVNLRLGVFNARTLRSYLLPSPRVNPVGQA